MYTVNVWNTESTNFDTSPWIARNGTSAYLGLTRERALRVMGSCINEPAICKAVMQGGDECLTWTRPNAVCELGEEPCECGGCEDCDGDCEGCPGHDELEGGNHGEEN